MMPAFVRAFALVGAVVFAASLASGIWLYVSLGRPVGSAAPMEARPAAVAILANLLIFGLFALHHSVLARAGAKARLARLIPEELERTTYVWVASLLFFLVVLTWQPVPGILYHVDGLGRWPLYALQAAGVVRHPIYLGWFLMVWPTPLMTGGRLTFAAISSFYLLIAIPWEERSLEQQHGEAYLRYTRQVRWRVIPGLY
jgi:protein-S-isoprenylcysteine O-methyltransferase Ste14